MATVAAEKRASSFVTGKFVAKGSYIFLDEAGNVYFSVKVGDTFQTKGNTWKVEEIPDKKNPKRTILKCISDTGEPFFLTNNRFGHLDFEREKPFITSKHPIETFLMQRGIIRNVISVDENKPLYGIAAIGGKAKVGRTVVNLLDVITDGEITLREELPFSVAVINNASYIVETVRDADGILQPVKVTVKKSDNYDAVIAAMENIGTNHK